MYCAFLQLQLMRMRGLKDLVNLILSQHIRLQLMRMRGLKGCTYIVLPRDNRCNSCVCVA